MIYAYIKSKLIYKQGERDMLFRELIVDNFAGGGGASSGIEMATGRSVDVAINHDPDAIAMHSMNHPDTKHYCESVWDVDPREAVNGLPVGLCWLSPDCKHFSKAKGGTPVNKTIRGLAWVAVRWAATVKPRVIMLENVEEFKTWGPIVDGKPCPKRKGETFKSFTRALERQGYQVEFKELRACDYGAPTIRKRLFMVARRDGRPIKWPKPTHGAPDSKEVKSGKLKPYRTAAECIDWSIPCPSIFERKRPLAENTMRRIAKGIQKFVIDAERPFIVTCNHSGDHFRGQGVDEPFKTIVASRDAHGVVQPVFAPCIMTNTTGHAPSSVEGPLPTQTTGNHHYLLAPFITEHANASSRRNMSANEPLRTQCAAVKGGHFAVVAPVIARQFGKSVGHAIDEPAGTITAGGGGKSQLVTAFMTKFRNGSIGFPCDTPAHTITAGGEQKRMGTANTQAVVTSHLVKLRGTCQHGQPVTEPMPTITAGGNHVGEVRAFLLKYYGTNIGHACDQPIQTITTKHRFGLVTIQGVDYQIVDIGMRMLEPRELFKAQGFADDYIIDVDPNGKRIPKAKQVARCGNAVPPPFAKALVEANLPELCAGRATVAA